MKQISGLDATDAYASVLDLMKREGVLQGSRNGQVLSLPDPLMVEVRRPTQRLITCPHRNANPFFHCLEFVWMMAGRKDAQFVGDLVKQMWEYAEPNGKFHAAYGHRWHEHFGGDQVEKVIEKLILDPQDRRAMIGMWDPSEDLLHNHHYKDLPCNTDIYFRIGDTGKLNMTVCNRSNDVVWGMMGANVCHMTMLQELVANALERQVGSYYVMTNNAHIYTDLHNYAEIVNNSVGASLYVGDYMANLPILDEHERYEDFKAACEDFCESPNDASGIRFLEEIAFPMWQSYKAYKAGHVETARMYAEKIAGEDWFIAAHIWLATNERKSNRGR